MNENNYVVIMAGGIGSRFWPMSRSSFPKQFHDVLGMGQSLLQMTVNRFRNLVPAENLYIITNSAYQGLVKEQLPHLSDHQILLEPVGRNTAPCVAYSCQKIYEKNPAANVVVAPSDHVILKEEEFERIIRQGLEVTAREDVLVTLGITPSRPDTGYGYIQYLPSPEVSKKVKTFTEKPSLEIAQTFLASGDFVWNAGIFIWRAKTVIQALETHLPEIFEIFDEEKDKFYTDQEQAFINRAYSQCKSISIDYGIMEKSDNVRVLLADFGWSDLGTWKSLYDISPKDTSGNTVDATHLLYDTSNCIIKSTDKKRLVVVQGLDNYIVAVTEDAVMICNKDEEQKVRDFVADAKLKDKRFV